MYMRTLVYIDMSLSLLSVLLFLLYTNGLCTDVQVQSALGDDAGDRADTFLIHLDKMTACVEDLNKKGKPNTPNNPSRLS